MPRQKSTHVDDPIAVGVRLRAAREDAGLSQRQLAFPGCSPAYISRIEAGDRIPSLQLLRELGRRLGVSEDYLATGTTDHRQGVRDLLARAELALRLDEFEEAEKLYQAVLDEVRSDGERAHALAGLGQLAFRRGDPHSAIARFSEALRLYGTDESQHPALADSLGRAYATIGEPHTAVAVFERCYNAAEQRRDPVQVVRFAVLLACALMESADLARAEDLLGRALLVGRDLTDPVLRVQVYWSQSKLHIEQNDPDTAAEYAHKALEILELTEDTYRIARAHQVLAHLELDRGRPQEALEQLREGWPLLARSGNPLEQAQFRVEEARALVRLGNAEEAGALAMEVSGLLVDVDPIDAGRIYVILGDVFLDLSEPERARELYELAVEFLERNQPNRYLMDVYAKLAELHESEGRTSEAYTCMKKALGMQKTLGLKTRV